MKYTENQMVQVKLGTAANYIPAIVRMVAVNGYIVEFVCKQGTRAFEFVAENEMIPA